MDIAEQLQELKDDGTPITISHCINGTSFLMDYNLQEALHSLGYTIDSDGNDYYITSHYDAFPVQIRLTAYEMMDGTHVVFS